LSEVHVPPRERQRLAFAKAFAREHAEGQAFLEVDALAADEGTVFGGVTS
jgi:hypothetical protein